MTNKPTGRPLDRYIFANNEVGAQHAENTVVNLRKAGITSTCAPENIEGTVCLVVTVTSKRPGEGRIAADMKARKA